MQSQRPAFQTCRSVRFALIFARVAWFICWCREPEENGTGSCWDLTEAAVVSFPLPVGDEGRLAGGRRPLPGKGQVPGSLDRVQVGAW